MPDEIVISMDGKNTKEEVIISAGQPVLPGAPPGQPTPQGAGDAITVRITKKGGEEEEFTRVRSGMERFYEARNARTASGVEDEWAEAERLYNQEDNVAVEGEWRSDAFVPHATRETNNAVPHMVSAILDADRPVTITAEDPNLQEMADLEERLLNFQLTQQMEFGKALEIVSKQTAMLGTGATFSGFKIKKEERVFEMDAQIAEGITGKKKFKEMVAVEARNTLIPLDITDIWVDAFATPTHISRCFYYERKSKRQIREQGLPYTNLDKLTEYPPTMSEFLNKTDFTADDSTSIGSRHRNEADQNYVDPEDQLHHLLHEWDCEKKTWSVLGDGLVELLAPRPWPTEDFPVTFYWYDFAPGNRFYGRGVVFPIAKSCRNANRLRRQRDDNVELCLNKMFVVRMGAVMDEQEEFIWNPGGVIHVRGGNLDNAVKVLEMGDVTQSAYADERIIKQDIEDVNGIGSIAAGVPDSKSRTATGTSILRQMAVLRLRGPIRHLMDSFRRVVRNMRSNNERFLPQVAVEHLYGPQAKMYDLYKKRLQSGPFKAQMNVHPASLYDDTDVKNSMLLNAVNIAGGLGLLRYTDPKQLTKLLFKRVGGLDDTDLIFIPEEQTYTSSDFLAILASAQQICQGAKIPVNPMDRHAAYIEIYRKYQAIYPAESPLLEANIKQHELMLQQEAMQAAGIMPAGDGQALNSRNLPQSAGGATSGASMQGQVSGSPELNGRQQ